MGSAYLSANLQTWLRSALYFLITVFQWTKQNCKAVDIIGKQNSTRFKCTVRTSVADPGSTAFLTPGSGILKGFFRIPDLGYQNPDPNRIFESLLAIF